jgi:hypothetical protein
VTLVVLGTVVLLYALQGARVLTAAVVTFAAVLLLAATLVDVVVLFGPDPERGPRRTGAEGREG